MQYDNGITFVDDAEKLGLTNGTYYVAVKLYYCISSFQRVDILPRNGMFYQRDKRQKDIINNFIFRNHIYCYSHPTNMCWWKWWFYFNIFLLWWLLCLYIFSMLLFNYHIIIIIHFNTFLLTIFTIISLLQYDNGVTFVNEMSKEGLTSGTYYVLTRSGTCTSPPQRVDIIDRSGMHYKFK